MKYYLSFFKSRPVKKRAFFVFIAIIFNYQSHYLMAITLNRKAKTFVRNFSGAELQINRRYQNKGSNYG